MARRLATSRANLTRRDVARLFVERIGGIRPTCPEYADDPVGFVRYVLEVRYLTVRQIEILESVRDNRETNVPAGYNVGKTFIAACIVLWWVFARGGVAVTTAPTKRQVEKLLWREVRKMYDRAQGKLGGHRGEVSVYLSETAQAWGFTASQHSEDSAAGTHEENLLAIIDEANGVSRAIDNAFKGWIGGAKNRGLRIGNPTKDGTPFSLACASRGYIRIPCFDHPNISWAYHPDGEGDWAMRPEVAKTITTKKADGSIEVLPRDQWPAKYAEHREDKVPGAVSVEWIEDTRQDPSTGPGSVFWQGRVLGVFPSDASTSIVPRPWFLAARARYDADPQKWEEETASEPWTHGLDVGDGNDDHALATRRAELLAEIQVKATRGDRRDNARAVALVLNTLDGGATHPEPIPGKVLVDYIGVGAGVLSNLLEAEVSAFGVNFGEKPRSARNRRRFVNLKAFLYWGLRERFQSGEIAIRPLPRTIEQRLMEELANTKWDEDLQGRVQIQDKKELREILGRSPDVADAVAISFYEAGSTQDRSSHW